MPHVARAASALTGSSVDDRPAQSICPTPSQEGAPGAVFPTRAIHAVPRQASARQSSGRSTSTPQPQRHASSRSRAPVGGRCRASVRESEREMGCHRAWGGGLSLSSIARRPARLGAGANGGRDGRPAPDVDRGVGCSYGPRLCENSRGCGARRKILKQWCARRVKSCCAQRDRSRVRELYFLQFANV
jgi:hypothetical protein